MPSAQPPMDEFLCLLGSFVPVNIVKALESGNEKAVLAFFKSLPSSPREYMLCESLVKFCASSGKMVSKAALDPARHPFLAKCAEWALQHIDRHDPERSLELLGKVLPDAFFTGNISLVQVVAARLKPLVENHENPKVLKAWMGSLFERGIKVSIENDDAPMLDYLMEAGANPFYGNAWTSALARSRAHILPALFRNFDWAWTASGKDATENPLLSWTIFMCRNMGESIDPSPHPALEFLLRRGFTLDPSASKSLRAAMPEEFTVIDQMVASVQATIDAEKMERDTSPAQSSVRPKRI